MACQSMITESMLDITAVIEEATCTCPGVSIANVM